MDTSYRHKISVSILLTMLTWVTVMLTPAQSIYRSNGKIAFTTDRDGSAEIYIMNADGSGQVRLTNNTTPDYLPTWSADGKKIAYVCEATICVMNGDGTGVVKLALPNGFRLIPDGGVSWSPDGNYLAIVGGPEGAVGGISTVRLSDSSVTVLTSGPRYEDKEPSWSPDGSLILFSRYMYSTPYWQSIMHTINPDGTGLTQLPSDTLNDGWNDDWAKWSPSGDKIVFEVNVWDFHWDIFTANADGTNRRRFNGCGPAYTPCGDWGPASWAPDGTRLIFSVSDRFGIQIFEQAIDGSGLEQLTHGPGNNYSPSWQPLLSEVTVGGRVRTSDGVGIRNAIVYLEDARGQRRSTVTSSFGYYSFDNVPAGEQYTISASSRRYRFDPIVLQVNDSLAGEDLVGIE